MFLNVITKWLVQTLAWLVKYGIRSFELKGLSLFTAWVIRLRIRKTFRWILKSNKIFEGWFRLEEYIAKITSKWYRLSCKTKWKWTKNHGKTIIRDWETQKKYSKASERKHIIINRPQKYLERKTSCKQ